MSDDRTETVLNGPPEAPAEPAAPGAAKPAAPERATAPAVAARRVTPRRVAWTVFIVVLLLIPLYVTAPWLRVGEYVMIGAVGAIGLTLLTGQTGQLSLGTPFFMLVGGTTYAVLAAQPAAESDESVVGLGWPPLLALLAAVVVSAAFGLAFAPVAGRVKGIYLAVATLALVYLGLYLGQSLAQLTGGTASGRPAPDLTVGGLSFTSDDPELTLLGVPLRDTERLWYLFLLLTAVAYLLARGAIKGRPGRSWRAVRDNESAAAVMGVPVPRVRAGVFAISSAYAGVAGVMTVLWFGILKADESEFTGTWSIVVAISFLAMILIGGLGSVPGAVLGAVIVNGLPQVLSLLIPQVDWLGRLLTGDGGFTAVYVTAVVYGLAIIAVVLFEPGGLAALGRRLSAAATAQRRRYDNQKGR